MTVGDPRPEPRIVDRQAGIEKCRSEGKCRACDLNILEMLSRAHLVPKGQRGDDIDDNIVPLCGDGTRGCHGALTDHGKASWPSLLEGADWRVVASALRRKLSQDERRYVLRKAGSDWLERVYPLT